MVDGPRPLNAWPPPAARAAVAAKTHRRVTGVNCGEMKRQKWTKLIRREDQPNLGSTVQKPFDGVLASGLMPTGGGYEY